MSHQLGAFARRRRVGAIGAVAGLTLLAASLVACGSGGKNDQVPGQKSSGYDSIIKGAPVADGSAVSGNAWAAKVKKQGYLKVGGTDSGPLFSIKDLSTGELTGFDAGLSQMLARYITGGSTVKDLTKLTITTVDTRETLLQNGTVDAVFATYTITPERAKKVAFAGPYYESGDAIMVKAEDNDIKSVADLAGKKVATESNSTAALSLKKYAPTAKVQLFQEDAQCVAAVQQGRVDAYVLDQGILISDASANKAVKVVGRAVHPGALRHRASAQRSVGEAVRQRLAAENLRRRHLGQALAGHHRHDRQG